MAIPSYCFERVKSNLKAIEQLKGYRDLINEYSKTLLDIKPVINGLTDEIKTFDRNNLYQVNGKDALELFADNLEVAKKNNNTHELITGIDSLAHEFIRAALEEFHKCAGG